MSDIDDRKGVEAAILGTSAFVAIGIWLLSLDEAIIRTSSSYRILFNEPMYARGLGIVSIVVFGLLALFFYQANYRMCGSPIAISANALKINFVELNSLFDQYQRKYASA